MNDIAKTAHADQLAAREREFDRKARRVAAVVLALGVVLAIYSYLAISGVVPAMPWSPVGKAN